MSESPSVVASRASQSMLSPRPLTHASIGSLAGSRNNPLSVPGTGRILRRVGRTALERPCPVRAAMCSSIGLRFDGLLVSGPEAIRVLDPRLGLTVSDVVEATGTRPLPQFFDQR